MELSNYSSCTAFEGTRRIASGAPREIVPTVKKATRPVLIFDDASGEMIEMDLRGTAEEVLARLTPGGAAAEEAREGRDGRNWGSSPGRSRCCRGTGTG